MPLTPVACDANLPWTSALLDDDFNPKGAYIRKSARSERLRQLGFVNIRMYPDFSSLSFSTWARICTNSARAAEFSGSSGSRCRRSMMRSASSFLPIQQRYRGDSAPLCFSRVLSQHSKTNLAQNRSRRVGLMVQHRQGQVGDAMLQSRFSQSRWPPKPMRP